MIRMIRNHHHRRRNRMIRRNPHGANVSATSSALFAAGWENSSTHSFLGSELGFPKPSLKSVNSLVEHRILRLLCLDGFLAVSATSPPGVLTRRVQSPHCTP